MMMQQLLPLRECASIAAHVPGRLRLKFSTTIFTQLNRFDFSSSSYALTEFPALKSYRVNLAAMTLILEYDEEVVEPALIELLFDDDEQSAATALHAIQQILDVHF